MREILFRGKRVDNGEWAYGYYAESHRSMNSKIKPHKAWIVESFASNGGWLTPMIRRAIYDETVGQYTGLVDKYGKQIFEGDILGAKHPKQMKAVPCLVKYGEYKDEDSLSDCRYLGFCLQALGKCCSILTPLSDGIEYEVIGNIHDNPELLEESL